MKVCHITTVHPNRYDVRIFQKECISLAEAGYGVTLIVNDNLPDEEKAGVKIKSIAVPVRNRRERIKKASMAAYLKALEEQVDLYHIHDPELLPVAVKLKKKQKKVIFDSHEFTAEQIKYKPYIPKVFRNPISKLYHCYETGCLNKLDGLVEPCTFAGKDYFKKVTIQKAIVGNLPKNEHFLNIERTEIDNNKVCYIGGLTEIRGLFHMIRGCYLAGKKLVLIGNITPELRNRMESMPEYQQVEYLGVLPHDVALKEASKCAIGLSLLEPLGQYRNLDNLPTKVYEYMMMGMPVVMSDFPYYKKVVKKYRFGITVDSTDDQSIADAIKKILGDPELMIEMGKEGKRAIKSEMNWQVSVKSLLGLYECVLNR